MTLEDKIKELAKYDTDPDGKIGVFAEMLTNYFKDGWKDVNYLMIPTKDAKDFKRDGKLMEKIANGTEPLYKYWRNAHLKGAAVGSIATVAVFGGLYLVKKCKNHKVKES